MQPTFQDVWKAQTSEAKRQLLLTMISSLAAKEASQMRKNINAARSSRDLDQIAVLLSSKGK